MSYRLLLDIEVVEFIAALPRQTQIQLRRRLGEMQSAPERFADFQEPDPAGRLLDVRVHCGFAIYYWEDFADRHVKVLRIRRADRAT
jgi:hypothetical protein